MLSVVDGRWKGTILWRLLDGPMRTSELRRSIPEMTERMLIRHLHEMVADGILLRHDKRSVPPHVGSVRTGFAFEGVKRREKERPQIPSFRFGHQGVTKVVFRTANLLMN